MKNKPFASTSAHRITAGLIALSLLLAACQKAPPPTSNTTDPQIGNTPLTPLAPDPTPTPATTDPSFNPPDQPQGPPPENPKDVKVKYVSDTSFELSWEPVEGADAYFVFRGEDEELLNGDITDTKFLVEGASLEGSHIYLVGSLSDAGGQSENVTEVTVELAKLKPAEGVPPGDAQPTAAPQTDVPAPSPTPDPTATASASASATATPSSGSTATPTPTPTPTSGSTATPTPTPTPTATATATATPTPTPTPTATATATPTPTPTPTATATAANHGNSSLGHVSAFDNLVGLGGIDVKNNILAVSYMDEVLIDERIVLQLNLSNGALNDDISVGDSVTTTNLIGGLAISSTGAIWSGLRAPVSGYNLYSHTSAGSQNQRYQIPPSTLAIEDIAVDGNLVYIASPNNQSVMRYNSADTSGSALTIFFTGATAINPAGVGLDSSGNVYATDTLSGKVKKYAKSDGSLQLEFDGKGVNGTGKTLTALGDVAVDTRNGDIYVVGVASGEGPKIYRYTSAGNFVHSFTVSGMTNPDKMAINSSNGHIYVTDPDVKVVWAFNAGT